uniref:Putative ABCG protein n=1 Tax=Chrysomela populi TaxID=154003 RepID=A0A0U9HZ98_CHRPP
MTIIDSRPVLEESASESLHCGRKQLKHLDRIARKPPVDIEFQDLVYSIPDSKVKGGWRQLLKSVNGTFRSGELTAIIGPSGAGKSTLLNVLAGYVTAGVKGSIKINKKPRQMRIFHMLSSYIMQEDLVQPRLSVRESMVVAANLKLGSSIDKKDKQAVVDEVLSLLGLQNCVDTRTEHLSGGQRKRLAIALELVNNPPVIFLDEPTTGLDNVSIKQCMELLQKITRQGRTVICTIHQPPASLFQNFDQVYVMANGFCVFNGSPSRLVPYMSLSNCICPPTSTPADFIIEVIQSNPENIDIFQNQIQNGKCNLRNEDKTEPVVQQNHKIYEIYQDTTQAGITPQDIIFPSSCWTQFVILITRMFLQTRRNSSALYIQFFHHLLSGLLVGGIYFGAGDTASQTMSVFKFCILINVFIMYTYVMSPVLIIPTELCPMKREYFNRWYSLRAYFFAMSLVNIPIMIINLLMFLTIVYTMSYQPLELYRFFWFCTVSLTLAICSQGLGLAIGSTFEILNGSVVAPHILAVLLAFAVYGMGYGARVEPVMKVLMSTSYMRYGLVGVTSVIFNKRSPLECDDFYCHYRNPELLMAEMGMPDSNPQHQFYCLLIPLVVFRLLSYLALRYRMTSELRYKIVHYAAKIVKQKET